MVVIRMQRLGRRNRAFFRIAVAERRTRRNGPVIEQLGHYDPIEKDATKQLKIDDERAKFWLSKGAQPSDTVRDMLVKRGLIDTKDWEKSRAWYRKHATEKAAKAAAEGEKKDEKQA
jgi:small subunit ribosomal protein S16